MPAAAFALILLQLTQAAPPARPEATREPAIVLAAERVWAGADVLWPLANSAEQDVSLFAIRALGRLEDPRLVPQLVQLVDTKPEAVRLAAASALAQTLRHTDPKTNPDAIASAAGAIRRVYAGVDLRRSGSALSALGAIAYANAGDVAAAEAILAAVADRAKMGEDYAAPYAAAICGLESLTRRNARLPGIGYQQETIDHLSESAQGQHQNDGDQVRLCAIRALANARGLDDTVVTAAAKDDFDQVRRVAVQVMGGAALAMDEGMRATAVTQAMNDPSILVRWEATQSYAKKLAASRGCGPLLERLADDSTHVVLAAIDALGTACAGDEDVTARITAEARQPPTVGPWQREAHAYLALAKRDRERAAVVAQAFFLHPTWQVRMYAARAAAAMDDVPRLERLALDENDNVREATLQPLRRLKGTDADGAILAAIGRADDQLVRTASELLKESPRNQTFAKPILESLQRFTAQGRETSRDARMALLDALDRHGSAAQADALVPLTRDLDPKVAARTAEILSKWTATTVEAHANPVVQTAVRDYPNLKQCVAVTLDTGRRFRMNMSPDAAPIAVGRFLKMALDDRYYDNLTFHRVEPNFVIQGGSPGANEYSSGQKYFVRDEIAAPNVRGSVGLSTRGRNTADGQFYVMLVDDPRLNGEYTIFANVFSDDMDVVDAIEEGARIASIRPTSCR